MSVSISDNKYRELTEVERENKEYFLKVRQMSNRIKNLKLQQNELNQRINTLKTLENQKKEIVKFKQMLKEEQNESRMSTGKMIEVRRNKIAKDKEHRSQSMQLSRAKCYKSKHNQFDKSRADHMVSSSMLTQYYSHKANVNRYKIVKAKMNQIQFRADKEKQKADLAEKRSQLLQMKIVKEREKGMKLKDEINKLEKCESQCFNQLNMTMNIKNNLVKNTSYKLFEGIKFNKNPSFVFNKKDFSTIDSKNTKNNSIKKVPNQKPGSASSTKLKAAKSKIDKI